MFAKLIPPESVKEEEEAVAKGSVSGGSSKAEAEAKAATERGLRAFYVVLRFVLFIGLVFTALGTNYTFVLVDLLLGQR